MGSIKIMKASAGSGKTYQLAYNYVRDVIKTPYIYRHILAVTFTNKATEEMKRRIIGEINDLANGETKDKKKPNYLDDLVMELGLNKDIIRERATDVRTRILHDYSRFSILTIDKFFQRIIRAFVKEMGMDMRFNLELQTESILTGATDLMFDSMDNDKKLREWIINSMEERMDDGKRWDTTGEIKKLGENIFKEAYGDINLETFNKEMIAGVVSEARKDAKDVEVHMKNIADKALKVIDDAMLKTTDFSGGSRSFVNYFSKIASGDISKPTQTVINACDDPEKWYAKTSPVIVYIKQVIPELQELMKELVAIYKQDVSKLRTAELLIKNYRHYAILPDLYTNVRKFCEQQNIMPISETNKIINKLVDGNQSPFIFEKMGNSYSHYMIDEFQDTSLKQWQNFYPLINNALSQTEDQSVLLVGDVKQSVYRWRGGDWKILAEGVQRQFSEVVEESLDLNFRSAANIVTFNNNMIENAAKKANDYLNALISESQESGFITSELMDSLTDLSLKAYADCRQKIPQKRNHNEGYVTVTQRNKKSDKNKECEENEEYSLVINRINDLQQRGYAPADIAILVRNNTEASAIASALLQYKNANPQSSYRYDVVSQDALLIAASPAVQFMLACFRIAANNNDAISKVVYKKFLNKDIDSSNLESQEVKFLAELNTMSLLEAVEMIIMRFGLDRSEANIPYIQALHEQMINFVSTKIADIPLFLQWWEDVKFKQSIVLPNKQNAITIMTIHKSKGLQYKAVMMPFCEWSVTPKAYKSILWCSTTQKPYDKLGRIPLRFVNDMRESCFAPDYINEMVYSCIESLNLLYVGATRAEKELHIIIPKRSENSDSMYIDKFIESTINEGAGEIVTMGEMQGVKNPYEFGVVYSFGSMQNYISDATNDDESTIYVKKYNSTQFDSKIRVRPTSERYFGEEDEGMDAISPRYYGNLMHSLFERIKSYEDVSAQLKVMVKRGELSDEDAANVNTMLTKAFDNDLIKSWFDESWDVVRSESRIIIPEINELKRPDRVMIRDNEAVVVDYKFGGIKQEKYNLQVAQYMNLLREMGYRDVRGYVWYVAINEVDNVLV